MTVSKNGKRAYLGDKKRGQRPDRWKTFKTNGVESVFEYAAHDNAFEAGSLCVLRTHGWPMGGEASEEACATDLHECEFHVHTTESRRREAGWLVEGYSMHELVAGARIVDNILLWSCTLRTLEWTWNRGEKDRVPPHRPRDL